MPTKSASKKSSKKKLYCGIEEPIPEGYRLGSMEECLNAGKVNYYGIKKIDSRLLQSKKNEIKSKELTKEINKLVAATARLVGKESRHKKELASAKTDKEKKQIEKTLQKVVDEKNEIYKEIKKLKEQVSKL
jgi:hypothetical protein